jgi:hypothetical protein
MLRALLLPFVAALLFPTVAPAQVGAGTHEFVEPWADGLSYRLEVDVTDELLVDGDWQVLDGYATTLALECLGFTSTGYMRMRVTARDTRSKLAPADEPGALAHRVAGLADGIGVDVLCDYWGVPERVLSYPDLSQAHAERRFGLLDALAADPATAAQASLAAALLPTVDEHAAELIGLLDHWAIPIGYTLKVGEPLELEGVHSAPWSTVTHPIDISYRLESLDPAANLAVVSRLRTGREAADSIVGVTPELVDSPAARAPFLLERARWTFDTAIGVPVEFELLELGEVDGVARRRTVELSVVDEQAPR